MPWLLGTPLLGSSHLIDLNLCSLASLLIAAWTVKTLQHSLVCAQGAFVWKWTQIHKEKNYRTLEEKAHTEYVSTGHVWEF